MILTGGLSSAERVREAFRRTGAAAVMLARGALGNPWLFSALVHGRERAPARAEVLHELAWMIERASEHLGELRAVRYLRKFYPWYIPRLALGSAAAGVLQAELQSAETLAEVRALLALQQGALAQAA